MDFIFVPTLQLLACVKIAVLLWTKRDVEERVSKFNFKQNHNEDVIMSSWKKIKDKVAAQVPKLPLPGLVKIELLHAVSALSWQLYFYGTDYLKWGRLCVKQIHWNHEGTVEPRKSMAEHIKTEKSYSLRYYATFYNCFVDELDIFWKNELLNWIPVAITDIDLISSHYETEMLSYWRNRLMVEMGQTGNAKTNSYRTSNRVLFRLSAGKGNETACRYFFKMLSDSEKEKLMVEVTQEVAYLRSRVQLPSYSDIFFFLFSEMSDIQKMEVVRSQAGGVLSCFLDWPRQQYFLQTLDQLLTFLTGPNSVCVLEQLVAKERRGFNDYYYSFLLHEFVSSLPLTHKMHIVDMCAKNHLMSELLKLNATKVISSLLCNATERQKKRIYLQLRGSDFCMRLAEESLWDSLPTYMKLFVKSEAELEAIRNLSFEVKTGMWYSPLKRGLTDEANRRLCSILDEYVNTVSEN